MNISKYAVVAAAFVCCGTTCAYQAGTYTASYPGISGPVPVTVTFSKTKITKVIVGNNKETVGIGQNAVAILPGQIVDNQSAQVDVLSGATLTSKAIIAGVKDCMKQAGGDPEVKPIKTAGKNAVVNKSLSTDLVIVGGGAAGMIAAINAADRGLKVVLLEKMRFLGGASAICGGSVITQGSKLQKDLGVTDDTPSKMAYDLLDNGHQRNDLNALAFYSNNIGRSIDWAMEKGVKFEKNFSFRAEYRTPRMVPLEGGCPRYAQTLRDLLAKTNVKVLLSTRATDIMMKNEKAVGIKAQADNGTKYTVHGKAVILATGGFGYNKDMLVGQLKNSLYYGPVSSTGDGHKMAQKAGAALQLMECGKIYPQGIEVAPGIAKSTLQGNIGAYDEAGIMVDRTGHRVINEKGSGKDMIAIQLKQPNSTLYLVLDQKSFDGFTKRAVRNGISADDVRSYLANNGTKAPIFIKGKTLEEAARIAGIDAVALRETVRRYNTYVKNGKDLEFNRQPKFMKKTIDENGVFYIVEQKPRFATTLGGVVVTTKMEVLDKAGKVIPNLYAAGEVANAVHGDDSAPGANVAWGITSGKTVSDTIADKLGKVQR